jgi:hypothetical protein
MLYTHIENECRNSALGNFISILRAAFSPIFFGQKIQSQTVIRKKAAQSHFGQKMLMKSEGFIVPVREKTKKVIENSPLLAF